MDNLEKNLFNLPKPKLSRKADWQIKLKIYKFLLLKTLKAVAHKFWHPHSLLAKLSLSALALFVLLGSTAVYAVNNDRIAPGHTFYPLKKTIESVEQQLALTESAKLETLNKISERRLKEALVIAEDDPVSDNSLQQSVTASIEKNIDEALNNFDSAVLTAQKIVSTEKSQKSREDLKDRQETMVKYLDSIGTMVKNQNNEEILKKIDEAKKDIKAYDNFLDDDRSERIKSQQKNQPDNHLDQKDKKNKRFKKSATEKDGDQQSGDREDRFRD